MAGCRAEAPKHRLTPPHKLCVGRELLQKLRPLAAHAKVADEALNANDAHESVSKAIAQLLSAVPCLQLMRSSFVPALEALTLRAQHLVATGDQIQVRTLATLPPRARDPPANAAPVALLNRDGCRTTTHRLVVRGLSLGEGSAERLRAMLIDDGAFDLFDTTRDPGETRDRLTDPSAEDLTLAEDLRGKLVVWREQLQPPTGNFVAKLPPQLEAGLQTVPPLVYERAMAVAVAAEHLGQHLAIGCRQANRGALGGVGLRDGATDAPACAGNQGHVVGQPGP
jgi:hypothetical protein